MAKKPTYEELEQRVKELEQKALKLKQAELSLQESEEKYRSIFNNIIDVYSETDIDGNILEVSPSIKKYSGYKREELIGKSARNFYADPQKRNEFLQELTSKNIVHDFEANLVHKNGQLLTFSMTSVLERDARGNPLKIIGMARYIADRKKAEKALRKSEERYALAQKVANVGSWDWNIQTGDLHWSEQIEPMFGFESGKFGATYEAFLECVHPEDRQFVIDSVNACIEKKKDYAIEHRIVWPDGTVRWVSETGNVFQDVNGKAIRMLGIAQDVTERKRAEEELKSHRDRLEEVVRERTAELKTTNEQLHQEIIERKQTEGKLNEQFEFLKILMDTIPNPIFYKDIEGKYTGCNKAFEEFIGESKHEIIGKNVYDMGPKEIADQYNEKDKELFQNPGKQEYEWKVKRKSGEIRNVVFCKATFTNSNGNLDGLIGIILDVTERKRAEKKLRVAKEAAEAASQAKSTFLANMSHELRTPLNSILGFAQILQRQGDLTAKQKNQINTIQNSGEHLLTLINDILDLARIEAQKEEVKLMEFNLPTLIHEVLSTMRVKAAEKHLAFHYQERSAIPKMVKADARKIRQVLLNLLGNAVKYTDKGSVTLRIGIGDWRMKNPILNPRSEIQNLKSSFR